MRDVLYCDWYAIEEEMTRRTGVKREYLVIYIDAGRVRDSPYGAV